MFAPFIMTETVTGEENRNEETIEAKVAFINELYLKSSTFETRNIPIEIGDLSLGIQEKIGRFPQSHSIISKIVNNFRFLIKEDVIRNYDTDEACRIGLDGYFIEKLENTYTDSRPFLTDIQRLIYVETQLMNIFSEHCAPETSNLLQVLDYYGMTAIDMGALKGLDDIFHHVYGDYGLEIFVNAVKNFSSNITNSGNFLTSWFGLKHGGDEALLLTRSSNKFLEIAPDIENSLQTMLQNLPSDEITNLGLLNIVDKETTLKRLTDNGVDLSNPNNRFVFSASVGSVSLREIVEAYSIPKDEAIKKTLTFEDLIKKFVEMGYDLSASKGNETKGNIKHNIIYQGTNTVVNNLMNFLIHYRYLAANQKVLENAEDYRNRP